MIRHSFYNDTDSFLIAFRPYDVRYLLLGLLGERRLAKFGYPEKSAVEILTTILELTKTAVRMISQSECYIEMKFGHIFSSWWKMTLTAPPTAPTTPPISSISSVTREMKKKKAVAKTLDSSRSSKSRGGGATRSPAENFREK